jgi:hypothetical protein
VVVSSRGSGWLACFVVEGCAMPINLAGSWGAVDLMRALGCWAEGVCLVRRAGRATTLSTVLRTRCAGAGVHEQSLADGARRLV